MGNWGNVSPQSMFGKKLSMEVLEQEDLFVNDRGVQQKDGRFQVCCPGLF